MLDAKVITPIVSPWAAPIVPVLKKNSEVRICIDFRRLNQKVIVDSYCLKDTQRVLDSVAGATYFSTMDLSGAFWQCALAPESIEKTSFVTADGGQYAFLRVPFGIINGSPHFQRVMDIVMSGLQYKFMICYVDDLVVWSPGNDLKQHLADLEEVFKRLRLYNLRIKPNKTFLFRKQVPFLGHILSRNGIAVSQEKVRPIQEAKAPENIGQLRSFVGSCHDA